MKTTIMGGRRTKTKLVLSGPTLCSFCRTHSRCGLRQRKYQKEQLMLILVDPAGTYFGSFQKPLWTECDLTTPEGGVQVRVWWMILSTYVYHSFLICFLFSFFYFNSFPLFWWLSFMNFSTYPCFFFFFLSPLLSIFESPKPSARSTSVVEPSKTGRDGVTARSNVCIWRSSIAEVRELFGVEGQEYEGEIRLATRDPISCLTGFAAIMT